MLNRKSPIPLYHQLAEIIAGDIKSGVYGPGDRIPSENRLSADYGIGRPTARQAVDSLVRKGLLRRVRGSGTFVATRPEEVDLFSLAGTMASFHKTGVERQVELLDGPARQMVDQEGNPFSGRSAIVFSRLSRVDGFPVLVEDFFLAPGLFPGIEEVDLGRESLSRTVREKYHLELGGGRQHFRIAYPDKRLARLLELGKDAPILAVNRFLHFGEAENAIYSNMYCRTDRFVFTQTLGGLSHA